VSRVILRFNLVILTELDALLAILYTLYKADDVGIVVELLDVYDVVYGKSDIVWE
jgi:hypothetical protein